MAALNLGITQDWSEHECSVFKINNSLTPPFYIKTLGGFYSGDDSRCFSNDEIYIILHRLKIKGVVATVEGSIPQSGQPTQLKIPLDYDGKFYIVSDRSASDDTSDETLTLRDILSDCNLPQKVRVANPRFHGKNFLRNIRKGDCTLNLTRQKTEDYFLGKSPDGRLVFLFSTESNVNFYVKKAVNSDVVKSLQFNVEDLKYDIFVGNIGTPIIQCSETEEVVYSRGPPIPRRPPRFAGSSTTQSSRSPPPPLPQSGGKDGQNITAPMPQLPIPPLRSSKGRHSGQAPLPLSKDRHPGQAHFDDKKTTCNVTETKPPPPLPPRADDEAYNMQLGEADCQNVVTDEEYDRKVSEREPTSPRYRSPPALTPIGMHVRSARFPQKNDDYYLTPVTSTKNTSPKSPGFVDSNQSSDSENLSDYEQIDSDNQSDYELVSEPTDTLSPSLPNVPAKALTSPSGTLKKKFDFKKKFDKLKINVKKSSSKKKTQESGDIADDELTEDPYADQHFEKRPVKKRPQRRRDDPLPKPQEAGPSFQPPPFIPTASPDPSFKAPSFPPSHSSNHYTVSESDDSDKSDYEQMDDDDVNSFVATSHLGMRSYTPHRNIPTSSTHLLPTSKLPPPLRSPTSDYPAPPTTPPSLTGHRGTAPSKIGVVKPIPPQPHARLNVSEDFPKDLCNLSVEAIAQTLRKLNIPDNVIDNFREAQIDGQIFVCLDESILDDLGVGSLNKLKIIKFKNGWRPKAN